MMKIVLDYPSADEEMMILDRMSISAPHPQQVITLDQLAALQAQADRVFVDRSVSQYAVDLVQCTRYPDRFGLGDLSSVIGLGASPRASLNLVRGARALAMLRGRSYTTPQDVFDLAPEILRHRLLLTYDALARDITTDHVDPADAGDRARRVGLAEAERRRRRVLTDASPLAGERVAGQREGGARRLGRGPRRIRSTPTRRAADGPPGHRPNPSPSCCARSNSRSTDGSTACSTATTRV